MLEKIPAQHLLQLKTYFEKLSPYCNAIYFGGSWVDPVIEHPHDFDYICFVKPFCYYELACGIQSLNLSSPLDENFMDHGGVDLTQIRKIPYTTIDWFSYFDILMVKLFGDDVCPKTDIIADHREAFIKDLKIKAKDLEQDIIHNQKRWYHILRGVYILINNSYEVTEEQRQEINILHDLSEGWESIRDKTIKLLETIN